MKFKTLFLPLCLFGASAQANPDSKLLDLDFEQLLDTPYVSIASGSAMPIQKAAAVATVITADDIHAMGATDLDQVLETVPGLHVSNTFSNYNPIYSFRGIYSETNSETLMLVNGIPITSLYRGDRGGIWGGMPVQSIARIEIIRGPGSAIYGADAFSGVINIITKTVEDIPEQEFGVGYGSFNTKDTWLLSAGHVQGVDVAFSGEFRDTDGPRETISIDRQTLNDQADGTSASYAPGPTELSRREADLRLDLHSQEWRLRGGYQGRRNVGNGAGFGESLDPTGRYESTRYSADLQYNNPQIADNWELTSTFSFLHIDQQAESNTYLIPPGALLFDIVPLPDGLIGNPEVWENDYRYDIYTFYKGIDQHRIRLGGGYYYGKIYQVRETKNFDLNFTPLPSVVDFSNTDQVFLPTGKRENTYASVQDEWAFHPQWNLTTGIRFDHFSDFGDTVNPRLALVWETNDTLTTKLLAGRAFRAPSFSELYSVNPIALGNRDLHPEVINTYEIAFGIKATERLHYDINIFHYSARDLIRYQIDGPTLVARNVGQQTGNGGEFEVRYQAFNTWKIIANYAYQKASDQNGSGEIGNSPNHEVYLRSEWTFLPEWQLNSQMTYVGKRDRPSGDSRSALKGYTLVDLILEKHNLINKLDASFGLYNLFNADVREPASEAIPNDLPKAGFNLYGSLSYRF